MAIPRTNDVDRETTRGTGRAIAALLAGAWRRPAPSVAIDPAELARLVPWLVRSGAAPLAWGVVRDTPLATSAAARELHRITVGQVGAAIVQEREIATVFAALRAEGIEPLLSKGWAIARHYPEPGLRPSADIDLFVHPADRDRAGRRLAAPDLAPLRVDLHAGFDDLPDRSFGELFARSELVTLNGDTVRVPALDDLVRHLALHLLRHAAWRPMWFADLAVIMESRHLALDWDRLFRGASLYNGWVRTTFALAHTLLGARLDGTPVADEPARLPDWLEPAVFAHWEALDLHNYDGIPIASFFSRPAGLFRALARRWPSPLLATVNRRAAFDRAPRLPLQIADCLARAAHALVRLPLTLREQALADKDDVPQY